MARKDRRPGAPAAKSAQQRQKPRSARSSKRRQPLGTQDLEQKLQVAKMKQNWLNQHFPKVVVWKKGLSYIHTRK